MESLRPLLTTYAYNILGSIEEAKDIVQDVFLKFIQLDNTVAIEDQKAYLTRMVINLSINRKKRQQKIISEQYTGAWLPEPVATEKADTGLLQKEILSYSLMVLLEKLNPRQRAVFILKEAFNYDHEEIAEVLGISAENSRKLLSRAKTDLKMETPATEKTIPPGYLDKYLQVIRTGDTHRLEQLLTNDITVISDGGGKVTAFRKPVIGKESVAFLLSGIYKKFYRHLDIRIGSVNHEPALFYYEGEKLVNCQVFSLIEGQLANTYFIRNPDKLSNLTPNPSPEERGFEQSL